MFRFISLTSLLLLLPLTSNAYHDTLVKGRVGYFDVKKTIGVASDGSTPVQKVTPGAIGEVALTKFFNSYLAAEVGVGCAFIHTQGPSDTKKKNSLIVPLNAIAQAHMPIGKTFKPYIGVGYEYQIAEQSKGLKIKKAGDIVYQAGIDLFMFDHVGLNLDCKYSRIKHKLSANGLSLKSRFKAITTMVGVVIPF